MENEYKVLNSIVGLLDCETLEEFKANAKNLKSPGSLDLYFDCNQRQSSHVGSHLPFKDLFAYFREEMSRMQSKGELQAFILSKDFLTTLQFLIFEFISILKGDQYQKGVFLENLMKSLAITLESRLHNKIKQHWTNIAKMKQQFESEREAFEKSDKMWRDRVAQLEEQIKALQNDKRVITQQMDRNKNQLQEYDNFHNTIRQRIRAFSELAKHLKTVNQTIPQLKKRMHELTLDSDTTHFRNCVEQLEIATSHINRVYIENDIDYTRKYFEGSDKKKPYADRRIH